MKSFAGDETGSVAIVFGISVIVLLALSGAAIDFSRMSLAQTQTQLALDSAVLAAGRKLQAGSEDFGAAIDVANAYFAERTTERTPVKDATVDFQVVDNNTAVVGTAEAKVETHLLGLVNVPHLTVSAYSKAAFSIGGGESGSNLEIALMLDMTGSMCDDGAGPCTTSSKLDALKTAAKDLINIVVKPNQGEQVSRVAIVPFATRVRVGLPDDSASEELMKDLTDLDATWSGWFNDCTQSTGDGGSEGDGDWQCQVHQSIPADSWKIMPCVTDRTGPQQFTDVKPGAGAWLNSHDGHRFPVSEDSEDTPYAGSPGDSEANPADFWNYRDSGYCADVAEANVVMPLNGDKQQLLDHIDGLEAYGSTAGALGTAWAWYMLSPNWEDIWTGDSTPGPYGDLTVLNAGGAPKLRKIAVLMTDGQYNTYRGWKEHDPDEVSENAKSICTNMKAEGIEIFTVGFELDSLSAEDQERALDVLQSCGSDLDHFYNALSTAQLKQSFHNIAIQLSKLYLAQ
jgi:Flp pilus assembly protein TadG